MGVVQAPGRFGPNDGLGGGDGRAGASERVYAGLLRLYPASFRTRYREEMVQLFSDQLRDAGAGQGTGGSAAVWIRTLIDLAASAAGEHLRRDRSVAHSLETFEPTRSMRLLGLLAVVGGLLLLWVYFSFAPFSEGSNNTLRLVLFALAGAAVGLAFHRRQAAVSPRLALVATAAVVIAGVWYSTSNVLSLNAPRSWIGVGGLVYSLSSFALWISAAVYGAITLRIGAAWRGMTRWFAATARMAALVLVIGGPLAALGDDRWGLTRNETYGAVVSQATLLGVFLTGAGWALLGAVLVIARRRTTP